MANPIPGAYRVRYSIWVDWMGAGAGPMLAASAPQSGQKGGGAGMQTKEVSNTPNAAGTSIFGTGAGGILQAADITNLLTAMSTDLSAQLNAQPTLGQIQGFVTGGG
jgi:hypothetical protein